MLIVDKFGEIRIYEGPDERPILYSKRTNPDGVSRGGAPFCCPNFGIAPESGHGWERTRLPRHGLVRLLPEEHPGEHPVYTQIYGKQKFKLPTFCDDRYPWRHSVEIGISEGVVEGMYNYLSHTVAITNLELGHNNGRMPLSFGWHPYFATHGQPFTLRLGDKIIATEASDLKQSLNERLMLSLTLETAYGVIEITPDEYDLWVIWSDDTSRYVCLEPVFGYQSGYRLATLETVTARADIRYIPR